MNIIGNSAVSEVKSYSDISVRRSSSNDLLEYICHAVKRARKLSDLILRSFTFSDTAFRMQIYQLYIKPILMYASPSW